MTGIRACDIGDPGQLVPGLLDLVDVGHVGHGAAGVEVGEQHLLVVAGQDVGRLGHEVDAAEDDELGVGLVGGLPGEAERVAPGIGPTHDLVALVVVAEDEEPGTERRLGGADHGVPGRPRSRPCTALEAAPGAGACCLPPLRERIDLAGGDSLVAHPRVCRPRCEVCTPDTRPAPPSVPPATSGCARVGVMQYRPPTGSIPDAPGSYQFYDADGRVLYVGKAKSLRHRLPNYFAGLRQAPAPHGPDGGPGRPRRVGRGGQRGRRPDPGALAHSGSTCPATTCGSRTTRAIPGWPSR